MASFPQEIRIIAIMLIGKITFAVRRLPIMGILGSLVK
jgi:hypothetical protein